MGEHECKYEMIFSDIKTNIEESVKSMRKTVQWVLSISIGAILMLIIAVTTLGVKQSNTETQIQKINQDYTPLFFSRAITGSNDRLIDVLMSLPATTKDDPRYLDAIKSRDEFQRTMLELVGESKRGGNSSASNSSAK